MFGGDLRSDFEVGIDHRHHGGRIRAEILAANYVQRKPRLGGDADRRCGLDVELGAREAFDHGTQDRQSVG